VEKLRGVAESGRHEESTRGKARPSKGDSPSAGPRPSSGLVGKEEGGGNSSLVDPRESKRAKKKQRPTQRKKTLGLPKGGGEVLKDLRGSL